MARAQEWAPPLSGHAVLLRFSLPFKRSYRFQRKPEKLSSDDRRFQRLVSIQRLSEKGSHPLDDS